MLHAAQALVRSRHCTQVLLQQPDQLIALPRSASRALLPAEQRPSPASAPPFVSARQQHHSAHSRRRRRRRFDEGLGHLGPKMCENAESGYRGPVMSPHRHHTATFCDHLTWLLGWQYVFLCTVSFSLPPQEKLFLCTPFVARIRTPRSQKIGHMGPFWGVDQH